MSIFETSFIELLNNLWGHLTDPNKRLFWGYLASTCIFAIFVWWRTSNHKSLLKYLFPRKIWLHPSAKQDYVIWLINTAIKTLIIVPLLFSAAPIAINITFGLEALFGEQRPMILNKFHVALCFTLMLFIVDDFTRFLLHLMLHKIPLLWQFHKLHHSAEVMTPITVYRIHPVESALYAMRLVLAQGLTLGLAFYLFGHRLDVVDVLGANIAVFVFNMFGANLRHSHVWLTWWSPIEKWFISPAQHQIHHSIKHEHYDKNFGSALAVWDRLFGSLVLSVESKRIKSFGLENTTKLSVIDLYTLPFKLKNKG